MQPTRTPFRNLPALLLSIGVGLCGYYGWAWTQLPEYSEDDLSASVELNLQLDLQRRGPLLQPDADGLERMRKMIRAEVEGEINHERDNVQLRFGVGLIALVLGLGQYAAARLAKGI